MIYYIDDVFNVLSARIERAKKVAKGENSEIYLMVFLPDGRRFLASQLRLQKPHFFELFGMEEDSKNFTILLVPYMSTQFFLEMRPLQGGGLKRKPVFVDTDGEDWIDVNDRDEENEP